MKSEFIIKNIIFLFIFQIFARTVLKKYTDKSENELGDVNLNIEKLLQNVQLPDFNTKEHKIKKILDSIPDY